MKSWRALKSSRSPPTVSLTGSKQFAIMAKQASPVNLMDLTIENITPNVHAINSQCPDLRLKYLLERVVTHLHDFARETRLSTDEWMSALLFLTKVGQICTDVRQVERQRRNHAIPD